MTEDNTRWKIVLELENAISTMQENAMETAWESRNRDGELDGWHVPNEEREPMQVQAYAEALMARTALLKLIHGVYH